VYEIAEPKPGPLELPPSPPPDEGGGELEGELCLAGGGAFCGWDGVDTGAGGGAGGAEDAFGAGAGDGAGCGAGVDEGGGGGAAGVDEGVEDGVEADAVPTRFLYTVVVETGLSLAST